jgi:hypothetical protein
MKRSLLLRLYPARWRERYGEEIADLLATEPPSVPRAVDMVRGLIEAHLHPELVDSALAAVPTAGEGSAEMRRHRAGTLTRLARVAMLTVLIAAPVVAAGGVGYYLGRSQGTPVAERAPFPIRGSTATFETNSPVDVPALQRLIKDRTSETRPVR